MADFYSPQLTEKADGTPTDFHSLGSSSKNGLSECVHSVFVDIPVGTDFAATDKIVLAIVPANFKLTELNVVNTQWITGSTVKAGVYSVNNDGTVGAAASAASDILFENLIDLNTATTAFADWFALAALDIYDRGKQMWELVNVANAGTYSESPGGNFALVLEVLGSPAVTIAAQSLLAEIKYNDIN
ncbi:MAG: hypothetical protein NZ777_16460 [Pseudomonadales bacterium]|nr:hypothetical protein [Pseudomonadales bacterium]